MGRGKKQGAAGHIRSDGVRASAGPWTVCAKTTTSGRGRLILALGRSAGGSATRSRLRRIARDIAASGGHSLPDVDLLLLARGDVSGHPRRRVRIILANLLTRALEGLALRATTAGSRE